MTNEEKILGILETMQAEIRENQVAIRETQAAITETQAEMRKNHAETNARFDKIDEKLEFLEVCINEAAKDAQRAMKRHEAEFHFI